MKVGDLVQHKRRGWLALILDANEHNGSVELLWLGTSRLPNRSPHKFDHCSMVLLEVVNESR